jgi:predicted amidohydrolase
MRPFRAANTQVNVKNLALTDNIQRRVDLIDWAVVPGSSLICFLELSLIGHNGSDDVIHDAQVLDGRTVETIGAKARANNMFVSFGRCERFRGTHYNTQVLVGPQEPVGVQ